MDQNIPNSLRDLFKSAWGMPYEQAANLVAGIYWDEKLMDCFLPQPLPTEPPLLADFKKLSHREREERLDPASMRCKAYLWGVSKVRQSNVSVRDWVKSDLLPAFERLKHEAGILKCKEILRRHEEERDYPGEEVLTFSEAEERYK